MALIRNKNFSSLSFLAMCSLSSLEVIRYKFYLGLRSLASNFIPDSCKIYFLRCEKHFVQCTTIADQHSWGGCDFSIGLALNTLILVLHARGDEDEVLRSPEDDLGDVWRVGGELLHLRSQHVPVVEKALPLQQASEGRPPAALLIMCSTSLHPHRVLGR